MAGEAHDPSPFSSLKALRVFMNQIQPEDLRDPKGTPVSQGRLAPVNTPHTGDQYKEAPG